VSHYSSGSQIGMHTMSGTRRCLRWSMNRPNFLSGLIDLSQWFKSWFKSRFESLTQINQPW